MLGIYSSNIKVNEIIFWQVSTAIEKPEIKTGSVFSLAMIFFSFLIWLLSKQPFKMTFVGCVCQLGMQLLMDQESVIRDLLKAHCFNLPNSSVNLFFPFHQGFQQPELFYCISQYNISSFINTIIFELLFFLYLGQLNPNH